LTTRWSVVIVGYESQPGKRMDMVARTAKRNSDRGEATEQPRAKIQTIDLQPYDRFELLPIAGDWRHGRAESGLVDTNPHTDDVLLEIKQADRSDLDAAFAGVPRLRRRAASAPPARAHVLRRAAEIMEVRRGEVVDRLISESGSTQLKANLEWEVTHTVMLGPPRCPTPSKAASFRPTFRARKIRCDANRSASSARSVLGTGHCT
jgi:aldehyde dehydrogenase (NAD+)